LTILTAGLEPRPSGRFCEPRSWCFSFYCNVKAGHGVPCPYEFNGDVNYARLKEKAGGRYKFICNCNGNDNGNRNVNCLVLDFCAHAAYYVVYCDVADWMLGAINYCQAAQIVFVENFEDVFVVGVGRY